MVASLVIVLSAGDVPQDRGPMPDRIGPILEIEIEAYPEGPPAPAFALNPGPNQIAIRKILPFVPRPLPDHSNKNRIVRSGGPLRSRSMGARASCTGRASDLRRSIGSERRCPASAATAPVTPRAVPACQHEERQSTSLDPRSC